jgi:hypothetical protein
MYDVNNAENPSLVDANDVFQGDLLQNLYKRTHGRSFDKMCDTYDEGTAIELDLAKMNTRIAFQCTGMVLGFRSMVAAGKVNHAWSLIQAACHMAGNPTHTARLERMTAGAFMRWRMALRKEAYWLTDKQDSGKVDPVDGHTIYVARYWLSPDLPYALQKPKAKGTKKVVLDALARAYNEYSDGGAFADALRRAATKEART